MTCWGRWGKRPGRRTAKPRRHPLHPRNTLICGLPAPTMALSRRSCRSDASPTSRTSPRHRSAVHVTSDLSRCVGESSTLHRDVSESWHGHVICPDSAVPRAEITALVRYTPGSLGRNLPPPRVCRLIRSGGRTRLALSRTADDDETGHVDCRVVSMGSRARLHRIWRTC